MHHVSPAQRLMRLCIDDARETDPDATGNALDFRRLATGKETNAGITLDLSDASTTPQHVIPDILQ